MTTTGRRDLLLAGLAFVAGHGALAGCARATGRLRAAVVGKGASDTGLLLRAAAIAPDGFAIDYSRFQSGQQVIEALDAGALDVGGVSEIPPVFAAAASARDIRQIAVLRGDVNNQVVLVPKGSPIRNLAGLRGRRVGYVRATTSQYFLIRMLRSVGLSWDDIVPTPLGVPDGASAFASGAIDAWAIYGYPIQQAVAQQGARVLRTALGFLSGNYLVVANRRALDDAGTARRIGDYLGLVRRGWAWAAANPDAWARAVQREVGVPLPYVAAALREASAPNALVPVTPAAIASQQAVSDLFAAQRLIPRRVDVTPLWDDRFTSILSAGT